MDKQWSIGDIWMTFDICLSIQKSFRDHHLLRPEPALVRPPKRLLMNWDLCLRRNKRCSPRSSDKTKQGLSRGTHPLPSHFITPLPLPLRSSQIGRNIHWSWKPPQTGHSSWGFRTRTAPWSLEFVVTCGEVGYVLWSKKGSRLANLIWTCLYYSKRFTKVQQGNKRDKFPNKFCKIQEVSNSYFAVCRILSFVQEEDVKAQAERKPIKARLEN